MSTIEKLFLLALAVGFELIFTAGAVAMFAVFGGAK